jgi:hypothetical protein
MMCGKLHAKVLRAVILMMMAAALLCSCRGTDETGTTGREDAKMAITVTSTAFEDGGTIPVRYTCDGGNVSPPLSWSGGPDGVESVALICDDPDAPRGTFVHWVLFNLPPTTTSLDVDVSREELIPGSPRQGKNSAGKIGYTGPCPPSGTHRYYFKVYALDTVLEVAPGITKEELVDAMEGHIVAQGQLMGRYSRGQAAR